MCMYVCMYVYKECPSFFIRGEGYSAAELLHELPENLRDEVIFDELGGILQNVPFFEGTDTGFLKKLIKTVSTNLHCPGDYVYHAGDLGEEMYFVKKGFVEILSEDLRHVVNKLGSGGYFGEVCFLYTYMCIHMYVHIYMYGYKYDKSSKYGGYFHGMYFSASFNANTFWEGQCPLRRKYHQFRVVLSREFTMHARSCD